MVMSSDDFRRYWARFGDLRAQESDGDERTERFTGTLNRTAQAHAREHPTPAQRSSCLIQPEAALSSTREGI